MRRRVMRLGGSSLVVTIPAFWARMHGLEPGDYVAIECLPGFLVIRPEEKSTAEAAAVTINFDEISEDNLVETIRCSLLLGLTPLHVKAYGKRLKTFEKTVEKLNLRLPLRLTLNTRNGRAVLKIDEITADVLEAARSFCKVADELITALVNEADPRRLLGLENVLEEEFNRLRALFLVELVSKGLPDVLRRASFAIRLSALTMTYAFVKELSLSVRTYWAPRGARGQANELWYYVRKALWDLVMGLASNSMSRVGNANALLERLMKDRAYADEGTPLPLVSLLSRLYVVSTTYLKCAERVLNVRSAVTRGKLTTGARSVTISRVGPDAAVGSKGGETAVLGTQPED